MHKKKISHRHYLGGKDAVPIYGHMEWSVNYTWSGQYTVVQPEQSVLSIQKLSKRRWLRRHCETKKGEWMRRGDVNAALRNAYRRERGQQVYTSRCFLRRRCEAKEGRA